MPFSQGIFILTDNDNLPLFTRKSPIIVTQNLINAIFGYVGLYFITRYVGIEIWGFIAFGMGFVGLFSLTMELGFSSAYIKSISEGRDVKSANGTYFAIKFILSVIFVAIIFSALFIWTDILHRGFQNPVEFWIIVSLVPYYFLSNMVSAPKAYYSSRISPYRIVLPSIMEAVIRNSIFIVIAILFALKLIKFLDDDVAIVIALTYTISYSFYFGFLMHLGRPWKIGKPSREVFRYFLGIALPLAASSGIATINGNIDKVIIQFFWHADATSALYTSQIITSSLFAFSGAISGFFLPLLSRKEKIFDGNYSVQEMERFISLFILPFILVFAVFSRYILNLFSAGYLEYSMILSVSAVASYFSIITGPYTSSIIAKGKSMIVAKVTTPSIVMNILLNFLLVPASIFGITYFSAGPAGTVVASMIVGISDYIIYRIISLRLIKEKIDLRMIRQLIPAATEITFLFSVSYFVRPYSIFLLVPSAVLGSLIFFLVSIAIKDLTRDEFVTFIKNLNPLNIGKNIRQEKEEDNRE